jgi:hypothetical protein
MEQGNEDATLSSLHAFNETNKTNFEPNEEDMSTREEFCCTILDRLSSWQWLPRTQAAALTSLRIAARQKGGIQKLKSKEGLKILIELADLSRDIKESCFHGNVVPRDRTEGAADQS